MRSLLLPPLLLALAACGPIHKPPVVELPPAQTAWHGAVDWESAGAEATGVLAGYLQTDTRNPPGNETLGARYLAEVLAAEGIDSQIVEHAPDRGSLIARLEGSGEERPICLLSHIDVVPWDLAGWPDDTGPLSGVVDDEGILWGRGALDMKGMGAIEVMTMIWLKRLGVPLKRDVILLAVADEEVDNAGARYIADTMWDEIGCSHMVNEGGMGVKDVFFDGQTVYAISAAEKGVLWLRMIASGEPGHGSTPRPDEAPTRLLEAIERLEERDNPTIFDPMLDELFFRVGEPRKGVERAVLTHPMSVRSLLKGRLLANPATAAMITNTVHLTGMEGANKPNVVPSEVAAVLDCRLQPGVDPMAFLEELKALFVDMPWVRFEVLSAMVGNGSPWDDPFFGVLARHLTAGREDAVAGPIVSVGFTDSILFRPLGVHAYGIEPFEVSGEELATMHGNAERISVANVRDGLRVLFSAIVDVSAAAGGSPPPEPMRAPERPLVSVPADGPEAPPTPSGPETAPSDPDAAPAPSGPEPAPEASPEAPSGP